jgi:VWFA-related protein
MSKWIALLCGAALAAAQTTPTFQVGTRLVTIDVQVRSEKGGAVKGLTKEDFTLQDKGKPQTIAVFAVTDLGSAPTRITDPLAANVASNRVNAAGLETRGATVILFDRLNIPVIADQAVVRTKIVALLASLRPTDRVGFYSLGTALTMVQDFGDDASKLVEAAKHLSVPGSASAGSDSLDARLKDALTPMEMQDMTVRTAATSRAFQTIARHLDGIKGRKNLIWVTSDFPLTYGLAADRRTNYESEVAHAVNTMSEANITVFPMDPRGVEGNASNSSLGKDNAAIPTSSKEGRLMPGKSSAADAPSSVGLKASDTMQTIANATGGKAYYYSNDIGPDVRTVLDEAEVTYTLGFYVEDKALDGKTHELNVKLAKKPETSGAQLHYRKSYVADNLQSAEAKQQRPDMGTLSTDALDATAIGIMAASAPDPAKPGTHKVQVRVDTGDFQFEHSAGKWVASFDLGLSMEAAPGKQSAVSNKTVNLSFTDEQLQQALRAGLIVDNTIPSPAQPARLRIVVEDKGSGSAGSVRVPLFLK